MYKYIYLKSKYLLYNKYILDSLILRRLIKTIEKNLDTIFNNPKCFICGKKLSENYHSIEHIFLSGLGDELTSPGLLCKQCNSMLGDKVDSKFINPLKQLIALIGVDNTRNKKNGSKVNFLESVDQYGNQILSADHFNNIKMRHPVFKPKFQYNDNGKPKSLSVNITDINVNENKAIKQIKSFLNKKGIKYDLDSLQIKHQIYKPKLTTNIYFPEPKILIIELYKMAIEFALICGVPYDVLSDYILLFKLIKKYSTTLVSSITDIIVRYIRKYNKEDAHLKNDINKVNVKLYSENDILYCVISLLSLGELCIPIPINEIYHIDIQQPIYYNGEGNEFYDYYPCFKLKF